MRTLYETHETLTDGRTVWVNGVSGACLARFSRSGIDVHYDISDDMAPQHCFDCVAGPTDLAAWGRFQHSVMACHGIDVGDEFMPAFLKAQGADT